MATTATAPVNQQPAQALTRQQERSLKYAELPLYEPKPENVSIRRIQDGAGERLLTVQELAWIDAMLSRDACVPARAAECAGYVDPSAMGWKLKRRLMHVVEAERAYRKSQEIGTVEELLGLMWSYARGVDQYGNPVGAANARSSQETLAKINGVLTDKVDVRVDRDALRAEFKQLGPKAIALLTAPSAGESDPTP